MNSQAMQSVRHFARVWLAAASLVVVAALPAVSLAQDFPNKPIKLIIP